MVAHAANAYFTTEDMEMIHQVKDVKKWSSRMREPMEKIYGEDYFPVLWEEWVDAITKIATSTPDKNICREVLPQIRCPTLIIYGLLRCQRRREREGRGEVTGVQSEGGVC